MAQVALLPPHSVIVLGRQEDRGLVNVLVELELQLGSEAVVQVDDLVVDSRAAGTRRSP